MLIELSPQGAFPSNGGSGSVFGSICQEYDDGDIGYIGDVGGDSGTICSDESESEIFDKSSMFVRTRIL